MDSEQNKLECNRCGDCCKLFLISFPVRNMEQMKWNVFWYNLHEDIVAQVEEGEKGPELVIQVRKKCSMLMEHSDGMTTCKVYPRRPVICQEWPSSLVRQHSDMPRCSMMTPEDKELDEFEVSQYSYDMVPPLFERFLERANGKGDIGSAELSIETIRKVN